MRNTLAFICLIFVASTMCAQNFKFATISDCNIGANDNKPLEDLDKVIADINSKTDIEFVLVLGNLSEFGDRASLEKAKSALDKLQKKYYAVSGDNETRWGSSGGTTFKSIFGSERFDFEHNSYRFIGFASSPLTRSAGGHIDIDDVFWLSKELNKNTKQPLIIATHHPLTMQDVDNWYEATDILRNYNTKLILSGHYHKNIKTNYEGIPAFLNRSTMRDKYDELPAYNIYEVSEQRIAVAEQKVDPNLRPIPWGTYDLNTQYYTKDTKPYKRPNYALNNNYPRIDFVWSRNIYQAIYSTIAANSTQIFFGDDNGVFYSFDGKKDNMLWKQETGSRIVGGAAANERVVVFGSTNKSIYGLNVKDGNILWQQTIGEAVTGTATIDANTLYIGGGDNTLYALDVNSGNIKWQFSDLGGFVECKPLVYKDKLIFGAWDGSIYAVNKNDGTLVWKNNNGINNKRFSPAAVSPVASHDKVFITSPDNNLTALNINSGDTIWQTNDHPVRESIGISEDGQRVYAKTTQDNVVCYSTISDSPEQLWIADVGFGRDMGATILTEKGGTVFGSTENGIIFGLHAKKGELLWKFKIGNSFIGSVVPIDGNRCYYVTTQGYVGLLNGRK